MLAVDSTVLSTLLSFVSLRELTLIDNCLSKQIHNDELTGNELSEAWKTMANYYFIFPDL